MASVSLYLGLPFSVRSLVGSETLDASGKALPTTPTRSKRSDNVFVFAFYSGDTTDAPSTSFVVVDAILATGRLSKFPYELLTLRPRIVDSLALGFRAPRRVSRRTSGPTRGPMKLAWRRSPRIDVPAGDHPDARSQFEGFLTNAKDGASRRLQLYGENW